MVIMDIGTFSSFDRGLFFVFLGAGILAIVSGVLVYRNESQDIAKRPVFREMLGGIDVFFTGRYLNQTGKRWRLPYVVSVVTLISLGSYFGMKY